VSRPAWDWVGITVHPGCTNLWLGTPLQSRTNADDESRLGRSPARQDGIQIEDGERCAHTDTRRAQDGYQQPRSPFALGRLHRELMELNPSAARSLEEGMEKTLTVHRLQVSAQLRRTLASTT